MMTIVLIRPGATDYDVQGRVRGRLDIPLNTLGIQEVAKEVDALRNAGIRLDAVYYAPNRPAVETADAIARSLDVKAKEIDGLENLNYGLWQGMRIEEIRARQPKIYRQWQEIPDCVCPPEGETIEEAEVRVMDCLRRLFRRHRGQVLGLVVAEPLASVIKRLLTQAPLGDLWKAESRHGQLEILHWDPTPMKSVS
ncbi:MAG: histidine phosphatase family protein [Thermogutta sp.]